MTTCGQRLSKDGKSCHTSVEKKISVFLLSNICPLSLVARWGSRPDKKPRTPFKESGNVFIIMEQGMVFIFTVPDRE